MKSTETPLLEGILKEAARSAQDHLEDARTQAKKILERAQSRAEEEVASQKRATDEKVKQIQLRLATNKASAKRKAALRQVDDSYQRVMDAVFVALDCKTLKPHLPYWIAEAAIGLDRKEAKVAYSRLCPVTEEDLKKAEALILKATGAKIRLHLEEKYIQGLGVVLSSIDGSTSFNNQVDIRLRRFERLIRSMIQERA
ncbi:MAG: V-type proton ATPase subunit E [Spirochaetes bacterium ADurb.Bin315]|jgi:V/A-type H+-transporting ATPase subunit E|nr:ATPase [Spirochaetota bacterium]OQA43389.1 MAG: V-type proton ATPase subunit E [Spirochaetes bacterium ADurb.Bin315]TAH58135.1 MAG: ATPase [Sphaerochaeta sp.]HOE89818.1 ATPase [Sphaerochaeta sp.]HOR80613.1 ATPase [Sphaerochaeta sp.]